MEIDTETDFITPEFLNILFFQQKNLVIFPYVDLKHLHTLEIFAVGHSIVDLESTALHNLKEILEFETGNSYSQAPSLYFIYNLDKAKVKEVINLENIRCILNTSENVSELANGGKFVFFNKKSNQFLNLEASDLSYEEYLISNSGNKEVLKDNIQKIKITASLIFSELTQNNSLDIIPQLLKGYDKKYWKKILDFTCNYFDINIPNIPQLKLFGNIQSTHSTEEKLQDFSEEYNILVSKNRSIGKEFIQLLHDYRSKRVNSSHLGLEQLFNPLELYNYLRNHHWKEGIPEEFIKEWSEMRLSQYKLTESDYDDFESIISMFNLKPLKASEPTKTEVKQNISEEFSIQFRHEIPSVKYFLEYKRWMMNLLDTIEKRMGINPTLKKQRVIIETPILPEQNRNPRRLIVDITNLLHQDLDFQDRLKTRNIITIRDALLSKGFDPFFIADASTRHNVDDKEQYKMLEKNNVIIQAPSRRTADKYVLKYAQKWNCPFLTNDMYKEYWSEFGKDWILKNRITYMFIKGELLID
ncbi:MAG: hypothetical protein ACFFE4_08420 [Candidatus Thorarchaeota archaeon]